MSEKKEVEIAFALYELISQLEILLLERYSEAFDRIIIDLDTKRGIDTSNYPF